MGNVLFGNSYSVVNHNDWFGPTYLFYLNDLPCKMDFNPGSTEQTQAVFWLRADCIFQNKQTNKYDEFQHLIFSASNIGSCFSQKHLGLFLDEKSLCNKHAKSKIIKY